MFTPRGVAAVVALAAIALVTTACGRDEGSDGTGQEATTLTDGPATGEVTIWAMGLEGESMPEIAAAFEAENPDADVTVTAVPWDDAPTKISTAIASGQTPDITLLNVDQVASFVAADGFAPVPEGLVDEESFDASALDAAEVDGTAFAVPLYVDTRVLFYRKDLAEQAGVAAPETWDDLVDFALALKEQGVQDGLLSPTGEAGFTHQVLIPLLWQAGAQLVDGSKITMDTDEVVEGLEFYQSLFVEGASSETGTYEPWGSVEERLVSGEIGAVVNGSWLVGPLRELLGDEFDEKIGMVTVPEGPANGASWLNGGQLAVFQDAPNPDAAWKFIEFISRPEQAARFSELTADMPAVSAAWQLAGLNEDPAFGVFAEQLEEVDIAPVVPTWAELSGVIDAHAERLARGTMTPQEAAESMQQQMEGIGLG
ncbi:extracellular solute-binding protein [uncultured Aeromicrobium sp.]|uniref:extracellular solute-binding protein n=1 Tax=uncultured Aeromicrobium sp. TaxID=337820 RepID=UPI0025FDC822|nr:extracellular solute-binding protein [uncultured Aeromicrobium sp.]